MHEVKAAAVPIIVSDNDRKESCAIWPRDHRAREYGFPDTNEELFQKISPIHHIDRVVAPMLLLHGDRDPRVSMHESEQFSEALARAICAVAEAS